MFESNPTASATESPRHSIPRWSRWLVILLAGVLISGCADFPQQSSSLPMGASKNQIRSMIGSPKSTSRDGSITTWNYGEGTVCVFKDGQLIASNYNGPSRSSSTVSIGSLLPPLAINFTPAPYYYAPPVYYGGGWGGWGGWGSWGRPWGGCGWGNGYGWGGGYRRSYWGGNNCGNGYYRGGNWNRGNYYNRGYYR